ncbi:MAG: hypothetical protein DCF20_17730 [Pseudanabaena sp.]|nr:MAG: hypothetical protein DCF20_17730 [Pseudanabaena sp.]
MASRIYLLVMACLTAVIISVFGLILPHDINLRTTEATTLQNRNLEVESFIEQGNREYQFSDYKKAIQFWQKSLDLYREDHNPVGEASTLNNIGRAYRNLSEYKLALDLHQEALSICEKVNVPNREAKALATLKTFYKHLIDSQQAFAYHQQSQELKQRNNSLGCQADSLNNIGGVYGDLGDFKKSVDLSQQALSIFRQIADRDGEAMALNSLGIVYDYLGKFHESVTFYQQALVIFRQSSDRLNEAKLLNNLGIVYRNLSQYQQAIALSQQSLEIAKHIHDLQGEANSLGIQGFIYRSLGQYQKAIDFYSQSLNIFRQIGDRQSEGLSLNGLGISYSNLGQFERSLMFYDQSLPIFKQIGDLQSEANTLNNMGNVFQNLGQYERSIEVYSQALGIKEQINDSQGQARSLNALGNAYNNLNQSPKAIDYYQKALTIFRQIGDREAEGRVLSRFGYIISKLDQPELAILFYKQSINVREAIRKDIRKLDKDIQKSYLERVSSSYKRLADLLIQQGRIVEALQVLDLLKVQELEDYLKNIKGSDRSAQGVRLLEPEKAMNDKLLAISFENSPEINSQLANKIQQLPKSEINKVPDYLQKIPQGTALLYPLILSDHLEIILFSPNTIPISRTVKISQKELENLVIDFKAALLDAGSEDYKEPAAQLYKLLIKPIEIELIQAKATTILYAPDGILRYIPIAALYDGKQWLAEKYRISNLIAYSLFDFAPRLKTQPNILAAAFGGKAGEKKFGQNALPATLKEVQAIANSFQNSVTLTEDKFSRQAIESKFKNYNILHLATHASFNIGRPENSFIIFGNGDKILLNEITDWQIPNIDLIVLSACQTGVGKLGDGVEILGFGYQVQKAGAKNAIASLWLVDDAGTQALMAAFYQELKKDNVTTTEALQRAQVSLIRSSEFNHPKYWSAFFAIGNGL